MCGTLQRGDRPPNATLAPLTAGEIPPPCPCFVRSLVLYPDALLLHTPNARQRRCARFCAAGPLVRALSTRLCSFPICHQDRDSYVVEPLSRTARRAWIQPRRILDHVPCWPRVGSCGRAGDSCRLGEAKKAEEKGMRSGKCRRTVGRGTRWRPRGVKSNRPEDCLHGERWSSASSSWRRPCHRRQRGCRLDPQRGGAR